LLYYAVQIDVGAIINLAHIYETGAGGTGKDLEKAIKLYREAEKKGDPAATKRLAELNQD
jgi:TPR repeat protein